MVRICKIEIQNFRSIRSLSWQPSAGLNCLIGPGDSGKTTILDAIDVCLGARRNVAFGDTDFFSLDVTRPIRITMTIAALPDPLRDLDAYGHYLHSFNRETGLVEQEPRQGQETVLTLRLTVDSDLEPAWSLVSERAQALGLERNLAWKDRLLLAPARLGTYASSNLSWTRGSVLNRLREERPNLGAELANAAREARASFGNQAGIQLAETLQIVTQKANQLGVPVGAQAQALLDAHSVSIADGAIALHDESGVPLRSLGTGSSRLLVAGLQRAAAQRASIALVDEVEYGLEPHRFVRLLDSLGAKEDPPPLHISPNIVRMLPVTIPICLFWIPRWGFHDRSDTHSTSIRTLIPRLSGHFQAGSDARFFTTIDLFSRSKEVVVEHLLQTNNANLRRCAPTACPNERGTGGRMLVG